MFKCLRRTDIKHNPGPGIKTHIICSAFLPVLFMIFLNGCAKVGSPTGGPKDTSPPSLMESEPQNRSIQFSGNEIEILFDEFIQLNNLNEELLISPPLENQPEIIVRNKSLLINLKNDLLPNTTYTMNFGNAIVDNNEKNALPGFEFVFSTGSYIDSLAVTGTALNAFDLKPPQKGENVYIMLYENLDDSVPYKNFPRYIGKVSDEGLFSVHNLHAGAFRAIALKDTDGDLLYDPITDAIAFPDSFVIVSPETVEEIHVIIDTVSAVDTVRNEGTILQTVTLDMRYFHEETSKVFLNNKSRESPEEIFFTFTRSLYDSVSIKPLNFTPVGEWFIPEYSTYMDTIRYWITNAEVAAMERIDLEVSFMTTDLSEQLIIQQDTVMLLYRQQTEDVVSTDRQSRAAIQREGADLKISSSIPGNKTLIPNSMIRFTAGTPVSDINSSLIELKRIVDSLEYDQEYNVIRDTGSIRSFDVSAGWEEESHYRLLLLPGAVSDIFGLTNDSVIFDFKTLAANSYGNIQITLESNHFPVIIQVMNEKEQIKRQGYMRDPGIMIFDYIEPGVYSLKAIHDSNGNKKWNTGNYLRKIQPEAVFYNKTKIEIRSNWDHEVFWQITD